LSVRLLSNKQGQDPKGDFILEALRPDGRITGEIEFSLGKKRNHSSEFQGRNMSRTKFIWLWIAVFFLALSARAQVNLIHSFAGGTTDGASPHGSLVISGCTLYGMTSSGGANDLGTIFKVDVDGTGFEILRSFAGGDSDGASPDGSLILSGNTLYGTTTKGGPSGLGIVFRINTDGTGFGLIYAFDYEDTGNSPTGSLILDGAILYGVTKSGNPCAGTLYRMNTNGTGYVVLHCFGWSGLDGNEGRVPTGPVVLVGSTLYGMTSSGILPKWGTIYKISTDGTGYLVVHSFSTMANNGRFPYGSPISVGSYIYGMTAEGGTLNSGVIFKDRLPGTSWDAFSLVHSFNWSVGEGLNPYGSLTASGSTLYGMTCNGGLLDKGTIFKIKTDGTGFAVLHSFDGGTSDGGNPRGSLIFTGSSLLGVTELGGGSNLGTVFSIKTAAYDVLFSPSLQEPPNNATGQPATVTFKWKDTNSIAQEKNYKIRLKKAGGAYANYTVAANSTSFTKSGLTPGGTYYWNVQAVGNGTSTRTSAWANGGVDFKFTVAPPVTLNAPVLVNPADSAIDQPLSLPLEWQDTNSSPQELNYKVRIKPAGGTYSIVTLAPGSIAYTKSGLAKNKTYYWSVQAVGNGTSLLNSVWPADFRFTTIK
jgi:uncharacterized repeat protein (TIGR03803 family)